MKKRYRVAVDIGGTFTDIVIFDKKENEFKSFKTLSTPENLASGVMRGIDMCVADYSQIEYFVHGTTSGLNAFLERKGAKVALLVTEGFKDVYEIGRANRVEMYNIQYKKSEKLVARKDIFELSERMNFRGEIEKEVDLEQLESIINEIKMGDYDSVAVCLLHSYKNPESEQKVKEIIEKNLEYPVSLSSNIAREWREYERVSTTIVNAYIAPIVKKYLFLLEQEMKKRNFEEDIYVMQSNGGVMTAKVAQEIPVQTLMSGPVGGTIGGASFAKLQDDKNLICVDMGGTSFDVSMTIAGAPDVTPETNMEGHPILSSMVNVSTIGAGGGSIAYLEGGGLRVGPKSAGSTPGPACYGNGGIEPTVTDANLVLGRIDPDNFLGGDIELDKHAAMQAVETLSKEIGLSVEETAEGILDIANSKMADAIRNLTVERGIDPRDFTMIAFGGAGPMHAVLIAEQMGIERIVIPQTSGTFSAWGMLQTDIRYDRVRNFVQLLSSENLLKANQVFESMEKESLDLMLMQNVKESDISFVRSFDLRYVGQEYTINILDCGNQNNYKSLISKEFNSKHFDIYGHSNFDLEIEIVNARVTAIGKLERIDIKGEKNEVKQVCLSDIERTVYFKNKPVQTKVYSTEDFLPGDYFEGPAIVEDKNSTLVIPESYRIDIDQYLNIQVTKKEMI